ncbi:hydrogenase maturation protease [Methylococcus sp. EFPC2]|nr:hydrogenase maturation protease [Methylococcus sp. EFPC2]QSA99140.1 hydrogenase maturation protease [Methylococcus sp. EFPC2]
MPKLLIFGYGNPSRGDDALGPLLLERLAEQRFPGIEYLTDFQLQVEHALDLEGRDLVLFVDAHLSCRPPFEFARLEPKCDASYTTHAMSPGAVLQAYREIKAEEPPASFLLSLRGERFELGEELSRAARENLEEAGEFAGRLCAEPALERWRSLLNRRVTADA